MDRRILTIIEAVVVADSWPKLVEEYEKVEKSSLPQAVLNTYLIQDKNEPSLWRIVTTWDSFEAMSEYRQRVTTPIWMLVFENVGAAPKLIISEVRASK